MKKILFVLVFIFLLAEAESGKIGYVDIKKIFENYKKAKTVEEGFKKEIESEQKKIDEMQEEFKKMQEEYEKKKNIMKPEEQQKKEEELKTKLQEIQKKWIETKQKLDERGKSLENQIFEEIKKAIGEFAKKNGYTIVLDSRLILYGDNASDLTDEIIKILNK